jgi:hypothetical protein
MPIDASRKPVAVVIGDRQAAAEHYLALAEAEEKVAGRYSL